MSQQIISLVKKVLGHQARSHHDRTGHKIFSSACRTTLVIVTQWWDDDDYGSLLYIKVYIKLSNFLLSTPILDPYFRSQFNTQLVLSFSSMVYWDVSADLMCAYEIMMVCHFYDENLTMVWSHSKKHHSNYEIRSSFT